MRTVILAIAISLTFPIASFGTVLWSTNMGSLEVGSWVGIDEFEGHAMYAGEYLDDIELMCVERQTGGKCLAIDMGMGAIWFAAAQWERDPIPDVGESPTSEEIEDALYGSRDMRLMRRILDASGYAAYHNWADSVRGQDFASRQVLKDSPNAWVAFTLDAAALVEKAELTSADVVIESIEPSGVEADAFDLVVGVGGAEIGEGARLAEALCVEGADELDEAAFSSENLTTTFQRTTDGKAKAMIVPIGAPPKFFLRVKVK